MVSIRRISNRASSGVRSRDWNLEGSRVTATLCSLASKAGLEPATDRLEGGCSILLSYLDKCGLGTRQR